MSEGKSLKIGTRVEVTGKDVVGTVAFVGTTLFSSGKWIGVVLDDAKGKNNGTVQGKRYFACEDNHGIFVRQSQLSVIGADASALSASLQSLDDPGDGSEVGAESDTSATSSKDAASEGTDGGAGGSGGGMAPRTASVEDIAKKKQQSRLSGSGLRPPTVGKTAFSRPAKGGDPASASAPAGKSKDKDATTPARENLADIAETTASPAAPTDGAAKTEPKQLPVAAPTKLPEPPKVPTEGKTKASEEQKSASAVPATPAAKDTAANKETAAAKPVSVAKETATSKETAAAKPVSRASAADISAMTESYNTKIENIQQQQEIEGLRSEVKDLQEKLETLKVKRAQDKTKLMEFEKAKIQLQQLQEYKSKMQETQVDLQRQLQAAKKETSDIQEAYERYKEEMSDVQETIELATLDKEMAEEKCESLQQEIEQLKEKVEELTVDLQIMKEDLASTTGPEGGPSSYQVKQLEQQNERMKEAIVKMRELSNFEKQEHQRAVKETESLKSTVNSLTKDKEKLEKDVGKLQEEVIELKEQVDAAQGAEEMVDQLTVKTLQQEEHITQLEEEKSDLEALCEMNDELQETARETELELREEVDLANARTTEAKRKLDSAKETMLDYETTIRKFRDHVTQLQENIRELRDKGQENRTDSTPTIEFDFKAKFAETKATAKAIDLELRKLDVQQANKHVSFMSSFMPDNFLKRGGDHDAILVLLFVPRMVSKCDLLITQVREKFEVPEVVQREDVIKTHRTEGYGFASNFIYSLSILQGLLSQYENTLNICGVDLLLKISTLLPEMVVYEKHIDSFIELIRKDQLDESTSVDGLDKAINYFHHLYSVHLASYKLDCTSLMASHTRTLLAICNCLAVDSGALMHAMQPGHETMDISIFLKDLEQINNDVKVATRKIKRRIPADGCANVTPLSFGDQVKAQLEESLEMFGKVVKVLRLTSAAAMQLLNVLVGNEQQDLQQDKQGITTQQLEELTLKAFEKVFGKINESGLKHVLHCCGEAGKIVKQVSLSMENGEYDFDGTAEKQPLAPLFVRANAVKAEFADIENLRNVLETKEETIKELKRLHKLKLEELGEQQVRMAVLEKKLETINKESDDRLDKLQQKLDDANMLLKKKEKEHEEACDVLQQDIDSLESEKAELKEKIKAFSMKSMFAGITRTASASNEASPTSATPPSVGVTSKESPMLMEQIESLREALKFSLKENRRLKEEKMKKLLDDLPPLKTFKKTTDMDEGSNEHLRKLRKDCDLLLKEIRMLCAAPKLIDISYRKPGVIPRGKDDPFQQITSRNSHLANLKNKADELQVEITNLLAANRPGGQVRTDFGSFPTPAFARLLHEKSKGDSHCVGVISIPCRPGEGCVIPLEVNVQQLNEIHGRFIK